MFCAIRVDAIHLLHGMWLSWEAVCSPNGALTISASQLELPAGGLRGQDTAAPSSPSCAFALVPHTQLQIPADTKWNANIPQQLVWRKPRAFNHIVKTQISQCIKLCLHSVA